jgi:hypothetical protein
MNDGGTAFGGMVTEDRGMAGKVDVYKQGMSLRDYFAGQALAGLTSTAKGAGIKSDDMALYVYDIADEMLKERDE